MKKIKVITSAFLILSSIYAQANDGNKNRVNLEITAGVNKFDSASRLSKDNASFYGLRTTIYDSVVDKYGLQLSYEGAFGVDYERLTNKDKSKESDVHRFLANLVVDGEKEWGISPYVLLGAGYEYLSDEIKGESSQGIADLGVGFRYDLGSGFNTSLEAKALTKFDSRDVDYMVNFALGYNLNTKKSYTQTQINKNESSTAPKTVINEIRIDNASTSQNVQTGKNVVEQFPVAQSEQVVVGELAPKSYYVQLAAFRTTKPFNTVKKAKRNGFENVDVLHDLDDRGELKRVVIGPFDSKEEANKVLRSAKRKVNKKAYLIKH